MWRGANEAKVDQTTEMYFLLSDPFITVGTEYYICRILSWHQEMTIRDHRPVTRILCGGVLTRPKWTKVPKCIFYCLIRSFRKEAIHEKL